MWRRDKAAYSSGVVRSSKVHFLVLCIGKREVDRLLIQIGKLGSVAR